MWHVDFVLLQLHWSYCYYCYIVSLVKILSQIILLFLFIVPPSETSSTSSSKHTITTCKSHAGKSSKKEKPSIVASGTTAAHKTVPQVSVKGHAPKHKASSAMQPPPQPTKQPVSKPLDFKQLMEIASKKGSGNKSKELVKQCRLKQQTKLSSTGKPVTAAISTTTKSIKPPIQAGIKKPQGTVPPKQVSTHKGVAGNKVTLPSSTKQRPSPATAASTTKKLSGDGKKVNGQANSKPSGVKLKPRSFYQSSAMGSDWSDLKKTIKRPQQQQLQQRRLNGFNVSGSWINELGLTKLPTDLDSDYEDDDMSDFVASDDEGIDEDCEDYSAAIRDIFGYDRSR